MLSTRQIALLLGTACSIFFLLSLQFNGPVQREIADLESASKPLVHAAEEEAFHALPVGDLDANVQDAPPPDEHISFEVTAPAEPELTFREALEAASSAPHSPTLTFSHIYVVSLPTRADRRLTMSRLADALNLKFTFIDAVLKDSHLVQWIGERVAEVRELKRPHLAKVLRVAAAQVGGMGIGSIWLARDGDRGVSETLELPSLKDPKYDDMDWAAYLDARTDTTGTPAKLEQDSDPLEERLQPADPAFNVSEALYDPVEPMDSRQVVPAVLSTWFSHTRAIKAMLANGDDSALFLEDDVDIEWDVEGRWASIHRKLPADWEVIFLGHCWGREMTSTFRRSSFKGRDLRRRRQNRRICTHTSSPRSRPAACTLMR
jgi:GR25 family glycosyltransferase involved in LPS biosynthesis